MGAIPKGLKKMEDGATVQLYTIIGIAEGAEVGHSTLGDYTSFNGTFQGTVLENGKVFRSKQLFLPSIAEDMLTDALAGSGGGSVEFAIEIGIRRTIKLNANKEEVGAGYEYTVRPIMEIDESSDPLAHLTSKVKKLEAPKK